MHTWRDTNGGTSLQTCRTFTQVTERSRSLCCIDLSYWSLFEVFKTSDTTFCICLVHRCRINTIIITLCWVSFCDPLAYPRTPHHTPRHKMEPPGRIGILHSGWTSPAGLWCCCPLWADAVLHGSSSAVLLADISTLLDVCVVPFLHLLASNSL